MRIEYIEELDTNTGISWWDENRRRLNSVIQCFNNWQIKYRFDEFEKEVVIARIKALRKYSEERDDRSFSDWQYEILDKMEEFIVEFDDK